MLNTGGGVKYFITPRIGVGGEMTFTLGPGIYSGHAELYRAFNLGVGAEFSSPRHSHAHPRSVVGLAAAPSVARAERGVADRNEISVGAGVQFDAAGWESGGMKLFFEYARRLGPTARSSSRQPAVVPGV